MVIFFSRAVAAIYSVRGYMEQVIFDSSYLLKTAFFLRRPILGICFFLGAVYFVHYSHCSHPSFEVVYLILSQNEW